MSEIFPKIDLKFYSNIKITTKLMIFFFFFFENLPGLVIPLCKVIIYNYVFVGFNSMPNLIVILFNLMCPVFYVGFYL